MKLVTFMSCALLPMWAATVFAAEPPPSPVAAPAAMPASAAASAAEGPAPLISQADLLSRLAKNDPDLVVLDVRTPAEFAAGHVPGARNLSHDELPARLAELQSVKGKQVVLYCRSGRRTAIAADVLHGAGFNKLLHLEGDWLAWDAAKQPVERAQPAGEEQAKSAPPKP